MLLKHVIRSDLWLSASWIEDSDSSGSSRVTCNLQKWEPPTEHVFCFTVLAACQGGVPKNINNCIPVNQQNFDKGLRVHLSDPAQRERDSIRHNEYLEGSEHWSKIMDKIIFCKAHRVANMFLVYSILLIVDRAISSIPQTCGYLLHGLKTVTVQAVPESLVTCRNGNHRQNMCSVSLFLQLVRVAYPKM